jgi:hypothetical protein
MISIRHSVGGVGNLMFKQAFLYGLMRDNIIPDVYVQSQKYWEKYKDEIKALFGHGIGHIDKVSLQIRRGDYLDKYNFYNNVTDGDYYKKAVEMFPNDTFLVFCHDNQDPEQDRLDKEWCKAYLDKIIPGRYEMNVPTTETDDMNKMASCKSNIIANSTFGWWSAFLNPNPNKIVVCPKSWFKDGVQRCELLEEWIKI